MIVVVVDAVPPWRRRGRRRRWRWWQRRDIALPYRATVELNGIAIGRIDRSFVPSLHPDMARIIDPAARGNAGFIHQIELLSGLRHVSESRRTGKALLHALELTGEIKHLPGCA